MMTLQPSIKIYLCLQPADMRKQMDGLSILAQEQICENPMSGHLFLFHNRGRNRLKILYWDTNGYVVWYKRLEKGCFSFPKQKEGRVEINESVFQQLLGGLRLKHVWGKVNIS
jgi:transposase